MFAYAVTVTVERPGADDRYGNPTAGSSHTIAGAFAPAGSTENVDRSQTVEWDEEFLTDYGADLMAEDVVTYGTDRYQVFGKPARWRHPMTGWEAGTVARLKAVTG